MKQFFEKKIEINYVTTGDCDFGRSSSDGGSDSHVPFGKIRPANDEKKIGFLRLK